MKLKKIVSLALAGVLAVSMLAGCGDKSTENDGASSNTTPVVTGITSEVYNELSGAVQGVLSIKTMSSLENILETEFTGFNINDIGTANILNTGALVGNTSTDAINKALTRLENSLGSKYTVYGKYKSAAKGKEWDGLTTVNGMEDKNVQLYAFTNKMTDGQINTAVAGRIDELMDDAQTTIGQDKYAFNLSAAKITVGNSGNGYVVVAVVIEVVKTAG